MDAAILTAGSPKGIAWRGLTLAGALLVSRLLYSTLMAEHVVQLMRANQFVGSHFYLDHADIGASLVLLFEIILGLAIFRPVLFSGMRNQGIVSGGRSTNVLIAVAGITLSVLVIPFTPQVLQPIALVQLITDNLFFSQKLLIPAVLIVLLPPLAEIAFQNLMFCEWKGRLGAVPAVLATSVVFALAWPLTSAFSAFFIALAAGAVSARSKTMWPGSLITLLGTCVCIGALVWGRVASP